MILLAAMVAALAAVILALAAFILLEALAKQHADDQLHTFSTYWDRAKRRHWAVWCTLNAAALLLCILLVATSVFLLGDLVLEVW